MDLNEYIVEKLVEERRRMLRAEAAAAAAERLANAGRPRWRMRIVIGELLIKLGYAIGGKTAMSSSKGCV